MPCRFVPNKFKACCCCGCCCCCSCWFLGVVSHTPMRFASLGCNPRSAERLRSLLRSLRSFERGRSRLRLRSRRRRRSRDRDRLRTRRLLCRSRPRSRSRDRSLRSRDLERLLRFSRFSLRGSALPSFLVTTSGMAAGMIGICGGCCMNAASDCLRAASITFCISVRELSISLIWISLILPSLRLNAWRASSSVLITRNNNEVPSQWPT